jgi:hypothetical protein
MKPSINNNKIKSIILMLLRPILVLILLVITIGWGSITHQSILADALAILKKEFAREMYSEIYKDSASISKGLREEDAGNRGYNHYGIYDQGLYCRKYLLNEKIILMYAKKFPPPPSFFKDGKFHSAYQWAYNTQDYLFYDGLKPYNWKGAIEVYDYSGLSKRDAYERLGHVIHLFQDICEPDHFKCIDHPGSSQDYEIFEPKQGLLSLANIAEVLPGGKWITEDVLLEGSHFPVYEEIIGAVGFELLVDKEKHARTHDLGQLNLKYWKNLGSKSGKLIDFFSDGGTQAWNFRLGFPGQNYDQPLGLDYIKVPGEVEWSTVTEMYTDPNTGEQMEIVHDDAKVIEWNYVYIVPAIKDPPYKNYPNKSGYEVLANKCTKIAKEYSAGLLQLFHDIVRHPPYVSKVKIYQKDQSEKEMIDLCYEAEWNSAGENVEKRELKQNPPKYGLFQTCKKTYIEVTFGPFIEDPDYKEATIIQEESVKAKIGVKNKSEFELKLKLKKDCKNDGIDPSIFVGDFLPPESWAPSKPGQDLKGYIEIYAEDVYNHYDYGERSEDNCGKLLDSEPSSPAKVKTFDPPYSWTGYTPGWDKTHINIGSFILPPPSVYKIDVFQADTGYTAIWEPQCFNQEDQPVTRTMTIQTTSNLRCGSPTSIIVRFAPIFADDIIKSLFVLVGADGGGDLTVSMEKLGGNVFSGTFIPPEEWKLKWGFVEVHARDQFSRSTDSKPEDAPMLKPPRSAPEGNWDFYLPGEDLSYKGEGNTFYFLPSK